MGNLNQNPETRNPNQCPNGVMSNDSTARDPGQKAYDLEDRTARFGEQVVIFAKSLTRDAVNNVLLSQLVRAATSIGANYCEADDAESKKDFRHKIGICRKESREVKHWLRMLAAAEPERRDEVRSL